MFGEPERPARVHEMEPLAPVAPEAGLGISWSPEASISVFSILLERYGLAPGQSRGVAAREEPDVPRRHLGIEDGADGDVEARFGEGRGAVEDDRDLEQAGERRAR